MESYSVQAVLSAVDNGFSGAMKGAADSTKSLDNQTQKTSISMGSILKGVGVYKAVSAGVNVLTSSLGGAIERYDKLTQFPKVLEGLGASTNDAKRATDKLKEGIDGLPTTLQDVAQTTQQMFSVFKDADKAADSTLALNNAMLASGSTGDKAARGTEQYMKILRTGKVELDSFTTLQETMGVGLDKVAAKFGKTGASAQSDLYNALKSGEISVDQFNQALIDLQDGLGGTADLAKKNSEGIQTSFTNMKNAVKNGMATTIETVDKALKDQGLGGIAGVLDNVKAGIKSAFAAFNGALPAIIDKIAKAIKFFGDNADWLIPILGGLVAAFASMSVINSVVSMFSNVSKAIGAVTSVIGFLTSPIGMVVLTIGALVAAGIILYQNWDQIKAGAEVVWNAISSTISNVVDSIIEKWESFKEFMHGLWDGTKENTANAVKSVKDAWNGTIEWFNEMWKNIKKGAINIWTDLVTSLNETWTSMKKGASDAWESMTSTISNVFSKIIAPFEPLGAWFSTLWSSIESIAKSAWEVIKSVVMGPILLLIDLITGEFDQLKVDASMLWGKITSNITNIVVTMYTIVVGYIQALADTINNIWTIIEETAINVWTSIKNFFIQLWIDIKYGAIQMWIDFQYSVINLWNNVIASAKQIWIDLKYFFINLWIDIKFGTIDAWDNLKNTTVQVWENIKQGTIDAWNGIKNFFITTVSNMVEGAKNAWNNLTTSVSELIDNVTSTFNKVKDIDLMEAGKAIIDSFTKGLKQKWEETKEFISGIGDWIRKHKGPISYDKKLLIPAGKAIMGGFDSSLMEGFKDVQSNVQGMAAGLSTSVDLGSKMSAINGQIQTQVSHDVNMSNNTQPAEFNINLGNRNYKLFVDDISDAIGGQADLNLSF